MTARACRRILRIGGGLAAIAGLGAIVALIAYQGFAEVGGVMLSAGWGIALVTAFHLMPTAAAAVAWRAVAGAVGPSLSLRVYLWARLLRESVNGLLPVAQLGGDVVGARILTLRGTPARLAGASVLADVTVEVLAQLVFTIIGLGLLVADGGGGLAVGAGAGLAVAACAVGGFLLAQRWGIFLLIERWLQSMAGRMDWPALGSLTNLHDTVMAIYRHRPAMVSTSIWHLATWLLDAVELWLTFLILGADVSFAEALVIESLGQALRSAAFLVPGAFGIQEGGYMLLGSISGSLRKSRSRLHSSSASANSCLASRPSSSGSSSKGAVCSPPTRRRSKAHDNDSHAVVVVSGVAVAATGFNRSGRALGWPPLSLQRVTSRPCSTRPRIPTDCRTIPSSRWWCRGRSAGSARATGTAG